MTSPNGSQIEPPQIEERDSGSSRVRVNGQLIPQAAIAAETVQHADSPEPHTAAIKALVLRRLIIDRARSRGLLSRAELEPNDADLDDALEALLALEAAVPEPTEAELRRFHAQNPGLFRAGERVHVAHILFAVTTPRLAEPLRAKAEAVLEQCRVQPDYFPAAARALSNCPSGERGGDLGWLSRGETVPEFERIIFAAGAAGLWPRPVPTRFGWHLIWIHGRDAGTALPFEAARTRVAAYVRSRSRSKAAAQYLQRLAAEAQVEGIDLHVRPGWLMQ